MVMKYFLLFCITFSSTSFAHIQIKPSYAHLFDNPTLMQRLIHHNEEIQPTLDAEQTHRVTPTRAGALLLAMGIVLCKIPTIIHCIDPSYATYSTLCFTAGGVSLLGALMAECINQPST